ncbi:MAG: protease HtpX [Burkholderiales bacterium]|jgi:heat shock protein HtpX|nr:protease HtpX [Burkholderiales bacterium]
MKRVSLLIATNLAVMMVLSVVCMILGLDSYLTEEGIDFAALLVFSAIFGFSGALISLAISKYSVKWQMNVHVITTPQNDTEVWLMQTVTKLAQRAEIGMPEVGIYEGQPNAFATGARRNAALIGVSTGLLQSMSRSEVEAVLAHEVAHVANGDMVTQTLIQGVVNTFAFFLARVVGFFVDKIIFRTERGVGPGYMITVFVCQVLFTILANLIVAWFSRRREFRADADSVKYLGQPQSMINALRRLGGMETAELPEAMKAFGIAGGKRSSLFATHPPIEKRIAALQGRDLSSSF